VSFTENFDVIKEKAADAAQTAVKKTKQLAEMAKVNLSIYGEEDKVKKAYAELGKLYYRDYAVDEEHDEAEYLQWCRRIDEAKQNIADLKEYLDELKYGTVVEETAVEEAAEENTEE